MLVDLIRDYNAVGITSISDRNSNDSAIGLYQQLREEGRLSVRVFVYYGINPSGNPDDMAHVSIPQRLEGMVGVFASIR